MELTRPGLVELFHVNFRRVSLVFLFIFTGITDAQTAVDAMPGNDVARQTTSVRLRAPPSGASGGLRAHTHRAHLKLEQWVLLRRFSHNYVARNLGNNRRSGHDGDARVRLHDASSVRDTRVEEVRDAITVNDALRDIH